MLGISSACGTGGGRRQGLAWTGRICSGLLWRYFREADIRSLSGGSCFLDSGLFNSPRSCSGYPFESQLGITFYLIKNAQNVRVGVLRRGLLWIGVLALFLLGSHTDDVNFVVHGEDAGNVWTPKRNDMTPNVIGGLRELATGLGDA